jgi:hypothetical protein
LPKTIETEFNIDHANLEEYDQLIERKSKVWKYQFKTKKT